MICSNCGGEVIWMGPFSALTHTECLVCGARNSQIIDAEPCDDDGPGEEDGPWAEGWERRAGLTPNAEVSGLAPRKDDK